MCVGIYLRVLLSLLPILGADANECKNNEITFSPERLVVKYGDPVEVNCSTSVAHSKMGWEAPVGTTFVGSESMVVTWRLRELVEWDASSMCYLNPINGKQCLEELPVVVYKNLESPPLFSTDHEGPMLETANYTLKCSIHNVAPARHLVFNFYKGSNLIGQCPPDTPAGDLPFEPVNVTATLQVTPRRSDDGAELWCAAQLELGYGGPQPPPPTLASPKQKISVYYGPEVINCPPTLEIAEGESLEEFCVARGNPYPLVTWLRGAEATPLEPRLPLGRSDSGNYTVQMTGFTNKTKEIHISVIYGPELHCFSNYTVEEYSTHNISCWSDGNPGPMVQWFKDGEEVTLPKRLSRVDRGQYHVLATSSNGNASQSPEIRVLFPPTSIVELEDMEIDKAGENVSLKCVSYGDPRPQYNWTYYSVENVRVTSEDGVSLLHIDGATAANIGLYTCYAKNKLGEVQMTASVSIKGTQALCPINFIRNGQTVQEIVVEHDSPVSVTCVAPKPKEVYWTVFPGQRLEGAVLNWMAPTDLLFQPTCVAHFEGLPTCRKTLNVTIIKRPENVVMSVRNHHGPLVKGRQYTLVCDILNVGPVRYLQVNWYKAGRNGSLKTQTYQDKPSKVAQNATSTLVINTTKALDKAMFTCEASLTLELHGAPVRVTSEPLKINVHYAPVITLPNVSVVPVFNDYQEVLVCKAEGNPEPEIVWIFNNKSSRGANITIGADMVGWLTCKATNRFSTTSKRVHLVYKEDYLPLIAGLVAVVVVIISVIFVFIYSIYYTNTKMGRYSLQGAKPNPQNGDVAQNGLDSTLPMKKLSQQNIYIVGATP